MRRIDFMTAVSVCMCLCFLCFTGLAGLIYAEDAPLNVVHHETVESEENLSHADDSGGMYEYGAISAGNEDKVKVLISLKDENVVRKKFGVLKENVDARRDIAEKVRRAGGKIDHSYNNINVVSAVVDVAQIEKLREEPNVISVERPGRLRIFLSQSVPIVNADEVWLEKIYGSNITGDGVSICVLDTGIDDVHPDLSGQIIEQYCYCTASDYGNGGCCPNNGSEDDDADDDEGHGTHVAGIVAANGGVKGVAKGANIIAIKIADNTGTAEDSDLIKAIDWCIDNSTKYNISVISLSMGGDLYTNYCDGAGELFAIKMAVDAAVANGISFVAATGNDDSTTGIAAPACLYNSTRVGATTKADSIASYTNRGANFPDMLLAPGSDITSTQNGGGYVSMYGTSMATPHVSGAIALLSHAYRLKYGVFPAPKYIEGLLNNTGKKIFDGGGANVNFTRIDALSALYSLGMPPEISYFYNNVTGDTSLFFSVNESVSVFFNVSADLNASYSWYKNGTDVLNYDNNWTWNVQGNESGLWNVSVYASNANGTDYISWIVLVNDTVCPPFVSLLGPDDMNYSANRSVVFEYLADDYGTILNCSLYTNMSGWGREKYNESMILEGGSNDFSLDFVSDGDYVWNVECSDDYYMSAFDSTNRTIFVDSTAPVVTITSPSCVNYSYIPQLNFSLDELHPDTCVYSLNDGENVSIDCFLGGTFLSGAVQGLNNVSFCMNDSAGNLNCTTVHFGYDSIRPSIVIIEPKNASYRDANIFVNVTVDEDAFLCFYDTGSGNVSMNGSEGNYNATISANEGENHLWVYCNDSAGNLGAESLFFYVDSVPPSVDVRAPLNRTYNRMWVDVNVTTDGSYWCGVSLNGKSNITLENSSAYEWYLNLTIEEEGRNNVTVYCNDSAGNMNYSAVDFAVNTSALVVLLVYPEDGADVIDNSVTFNYTSEGFDIVNCTLYGNFSGVWGDDESNKTPVLMDAVNTIVATLDDGEFLWNVRCEDSFGTYAFGSANYSFKVGGWWICTDNDGDGYGTGEGCAGPDCDDSNGGIYTGCSSGSGTTWHSTAAVIADAPDENTNESSEEEREVRDEDTSENDTEVIENASQKRVTLSIATDIIGIKDIIYQLKSENKMNESESEYYLSRLEEVMQLYQVGNWGDAQKIMNEVRRELEYKNSTADEDYGAEGPGFNAVVAFGIVFVFAGAVLKLSLKRDSRKMSSMKKYIRKCLDEGFSEDDVKSKLVESGWSEDVVMKAVGEVKKH